MYRPEARALGPRLVETKVSEAGLLVEKLRVLDGLDRKAAEKTEAVAKKAMDGILIGKEDGMFATICSGVGTKNETCPVPHVCGSCRRVLLKFRWRSNCLEELVQSVSGQGSFLARLVRSMFPRPSMATSLSMQLPPYGQPFLNDDGRQGYPFAGKRSAATMRWVSPMGVCG
ncbi:hypothetical protein BC567DRAFT_56989 [Phyllosticta citribraziliensis]